jgi:phosphoribosylanthranilate isomerase
VNSMPLWIKICANTSLGDVCVAAEAGADAVGFVFAPSPRRVTPDQVAKIVPHLPLGLEKIGVFVDSTFDEIEKTVRVCALTGVQLHSDSGPEMTAQLRDRLGLELRILRVVHFGSNAAEQAEALAQDPHINGILVDSRTATAIGGTGVSFDWAQARKTIFRDPPASTTHEPGPSNSGKHLIVAGGLNPVNVAEAIATLRPWGVDVASGVEATPGRKDPAKIRAFVARARAAMWE